MFFDGNFNGPKYLEFFLNFLITALVPLLPNENASLLHCKTLWLQQNDANAHFAVEVWVVTRV